MIQASTTRSSASHRLTSVTVIALASCPQLLSCDDSDATAAAGSSGSTSSEVGGQAATGSGGAGGATSSAGGATSSGSGGSGQALSCANGGPGRDDCGANGDADCCASLPVDGGAFLRSYDGVEHNDDGFPATVGDFRLDVYEVTLGRFRAFVDAGRGTQEQPPIPGAGAHPAISGSGWRAEWDDSLPQDTNALKSAISSCGLWTDSPGDVEQLPMSCVTWFEAVAFCAWDGARLPTEAEWNYAAAGGDEQRVYPWSSPPGDTTIDCSYATYDTCEAVNGHYLLGVGAKPAGNGRWGHADLGGNVYEWVFDWYDHYALTHPCVDCAKSDDGGINIYRVLRGGYYASNDTHVRAANRFSQTPTLRTFGWGMRCARAL